MNAEIALAYIPRRMNELGIGDNYLMEFRHLKTKTKSSMVINADGMYFYLIEETHSNIRVSSENGVFDLADSNITEQCYEHTGTITVENKTTDPVYLKFIHVTPKHQ